MGGRIFLGGGGDGKQSFDVDKFFFGNVKKLLYIPWAWHNDDFDSCFRWFSNLVREHKKVEFEMLSDWNKFIDLKKYDSVYIGGGNTYKLLQRLRKGGFDKNLPEFYFCGGNIYGCSAGAIIWGNNIDIAMICKDGDENLVALKDTCGFNFVKGFDIQCHYEDEQEREHLDYVRENKRNVVAIPESSAVIVCDGAFKCVGQKPVTVFKGDDSEIYCSGKQLEL